jgi:transposase
MGRVVIGMDPHKRSATIEVLDDRERVLQVGRFGTDRDGYKQLLTAGRSWPDRVWAVEGCNGVGRHIAQRLVADGEPVVDVPAKLSARARVFSTGQGRKTDATDAHSVAVVALRTPGLRPVQVDDTTVALRLLVDRRDELGAARTWTVNRLHRLLLELVPGGAKQFLSATQAKTLLATVRPRDVVGKTRRKLAAELVVELDGIDKRIKAANKELRELLEATGSTLLELNGIGPSGAARLLGDIGDVSRFPTRGHFASWNGTAPIDASSGEQNRHRLSRAGNRRINRVLHIMAIVQLRNDTEGRAYYRRKVAARQNHHGSDPSPQTTTVRHRLPPARGRSETTTASKRSDGPGRTNGGGYWLQRGRLQPQRRRFGEVTSRTRQARVWPATTDLPDHSSARSRRQLAAPTRSGRQAQSA